ncbi:MAG: hypothetical protein JSW11_21125 [Candidatus Heimdallarchaeota archaeon]|nr:MAG: hypothetical protein JSW11_21125 [Candidatus Heimdallarchaeota archaeon]
MANRKWHLITAIIVFLIYIVIYWFVNMNYISELKEISPLWIVTAFLMALIGAEAPDWDLLLNWMHHRDIATHSVFIPLIIAITFFIQKFMGFPEEILILALVFTPFFLGFASHLLLDLFPSVDPEKEVKEKGVTRTTAMLVGGFVSGLTGMETIKALQGTYLIHLPFKMPVKSEKERDTWEMRRTLPLHASRWWLFFNGLITGLLGIFLLVILIWG